MYIPLQLFPTVSFLGRILLPKISLQRRLKIAGKRVETLAKVHHLPSAASRFVATPTRDIPLGLDVFVSLQYNGHCLVVASTGASFRRFIIQDYPDVNSHIPHHLADDSKGLTGSLDDQ